LFNYTISLRQTRYYNSLFLELIHQNQKNKIIFKRYNIEVVIFYSFDYSKIYFLVIFGFINLFLTFKNQPNKTMKKGNQFFNFFLLALLFIGFTNTASAQYNYGERLHYNYPWKVNVQMSMINRNFNKSEPTSTEHANMATLPKLSLEYYAGSNFSFKASILSSEVKADNTVNGLIARENFNVFAVDALAIYSLGGAINIPIVDPYIETGLGYTHFNKDSKAMFNFGGGLNIWMKDTNLFKVGQYNRDLLINRFGLNLEVLAQKNLSSGPGTNVQYSAGIFFVF